MTVEDYTGAVRNGAVVYLYNSQGALVGGVTNPKTTDGSGQASWTGADGIDFNDYVVEAYYNGAFWARAYITVPYGPATNVTLTQSEPYVSIFKVFNGATEVTGGTVPVNTPLRIEVTVTNPTASDQTVQVPLALDRSRSFPYDFSDPVDPNPPQTQTIASGGTYKFIFNFTPVFSGAYYRLLEVDTEINGVYTATDKYIWPSTFTVSTSTSGALNVTVKDYDGGTRSGAIVYLYDAQGALVNSVANPKVTDANGNVSWTGIDCAEYVLEAYYNNAFWVRDSVSVPFGPATSKILQRDEPYFWSFKVFSGGNDVTNGAIAPYAPLSVEIQVKNPNPSSRSVKVQLKLDRDRSDPFDIAPPASDAQTIPGGGTATFTLNPSQAPSVSGAYSYLVEVDSQVDAPYIATDFHGWNNTFTVAPSIGNLVVNVQDQNSANVSGAVVLRYALDGTYIDRKTTGADGKTTWTGIASADYRLEAYVNNAFWVDDIATVAAGVSNEVILKRDEPYVADFKVFNNNTNANVTNSYVQVNTPLRIEVTVRNDSPAARIVRVNALVDRSKSSAYDFSQTSTSQVIPGHTSLTFVFLPPYTPKSTGSFYRRVSVESVVNGNYIYTDLPTAWTTPAVFTTVTVAPVTISGHVLTSLGDPMEGVVMRAIASNGVTITAQTTTDGDGYYELVVPSNWTGKVLPAEFDYFPGYAFYPGTRSYSKVLVNQTAQDFTGYAPYTITGHVRLLNSAPAAGVVVTATNGGGTSTTGADGFYSLIVPGGPNGWTGLVVPSMSGVAFAPPYRYYAGIAADQASQDFTAYLGDSVDSLIVSGPTSVKEMFSADYTCTAHYISGRTADVTRLATWKDNSSYTVIDSAGHLTANNVGGDTTVKITASYAGRTSPSYSVLVRRVVSLTITGPAQVNESSSADYTVTATYSDASTVDVTALATWSDDSSYASFTAPGHLTTTAVTSNKTVHITAKFAGVTKTVTITIQNS